MEIVRTAKPARNMENVTVWHCDGCGVVHMSVGKMVLSFTREEFADFTDAVVDINYSGWNSGRSIFEFASFATVDTLH